MAIFNQRNIHVNIILKLNRPSGVAFPLAGGRAVPLITRSRAGGQPR